MQGCQALRSKYKPGRGERLLALSPLTSRRICSSNLGWSKLVPSQGCFQLWFSWSWAVLAFCSMPRSGSRFFLFESCSLWTQYDWFGPHVIYGHCVTNLARMWFMHTVRPIWSSCGLRTLCDQFGRHMIYGHCDQFGHHVVYGRYVTNLALMWFTDTV